MKPWSRSHLADHEVVHAFTATVAHDRTTTAELLADLGELDARKLYVPAGYPSMHAYCTGAHHMSEGTAFKRIRVARTARQFPVIFDTVAEGRLNLSGVILLAPYLQTETADELIAAATHKTRDEIERLVAERFPKPDVATSVVAIAPASDLLGAGADASGACQLSPGTVGMTSTQQAVDVPAPRARVTPLAPQRFEVKFTIGQDAHELLSRAQDLLANAVPSGDVGEVLLRALRVLVEKLEKQRFAATDRPRPRRQRRSENPRTIPAEVQRAVWERDGGQCTFVSDRGHRCEERRFLQFDYVNPVARGGEATEGNLRLRCGPHNQHAADLMFGKGFMNDKRQEAQRRAAEAKVQKAAAAAVRVRERAAVEAELAAASDVIPGLKLLGCRGDELRLAATLCAGIPDAPTEERMLCALKGLGRARMRQSVHFARSRA